MIFSKEQMFSDGQPIAAAATTTSTNVIDLGVGAAGTGTVRGATVPLIRDVGPGEPVAVSVTVSSVGGANTLQVNLIQSTAANMAAPDILGSSRLVTLVSGKPAQFGFNFLPDGISKRYIALSYVTTTAAAITIDAGITMGKQSNVTVAAA